MGAPRDMVLVSRIEARILWLHGDKVLLDSDLAALYGVTTKQLNQQVRRNRARFPGDLMLCLSAAEVRDLRSQIVTSTEWGGRRHLPLAFTEQGVAMLSSVLRSEQAMRVNVEIMRAFVRLRRLLATHADLARKLEALETKYHAQFRGVFQAIRALMASEVEPRRRIGFGK